MPVSIQYIQQKHAENAAGDHFSEEYGQEGEPQRFDSVGIQQNERHDERVCSDGGDRRKPLAFAKHAGTDSAEEGREGAENNVRKRTAGQNIGEQTTDCESGNCSGSKKGKDGQSFRKADLNGIICQTESVGEQSQHNIEGSNDCCVCDKTNFLIHNVSFSFVLGVEGLEHTVVCFWHSSHENISCSVEKSNVFL